MSPAGPTARPQRVSVRAYQVGFGDCFLLSFSYQRALPDGRNERHVMLDFGSTRWPKHSATRYTDIAQSIAERTGGKLDALVITHRHKDHLAGFADDQAAATIAALEPALVVRPWTEIPDDAVGETAGRGERSRRFAASLASAQEFAFEVGRAIAPDDRRDVARGLSAMAAEQVANKEAIDRIDAIAAAARLRARYLHAGQASGIDRLIPGVRVGVLGPPTLEQWPQVAGQREDDEEYWINQRGLLARMLAAAGAGADIEAAAAHAEELAPDPGPVRWLVEKMRDQHAHSLLRIVRTLDDALNNTSVILLFEAGDRRLLFPGDAQIENWSYALTSPKATKLRQELPAVDLYKVGHHGSRNATPRSLVSLWDGRRRGVTSLMSTMPGVHGKSEATAVPRKALTDALERVGTLHRTDRLPSDRLFLEVSAPIDGDKPFTPTP